MLHTVESLRLANPLDVNRAALFEFEKTSWYHETADSGIAFLDAIRAFRNVTPESHSRHMAVRASDVDTYFQVAQGADDNVVALVDGDIEHNYLRKLYVAPGLQSRGIGAWLLGEYESRASEGPIGLSVLTGNIRAQAFYKRHGYETIDPKRRRMGRGIVSIDMVKTRRQTA